MSNHVQRASLRIGYETLDLQPGEPIPDHQTQFRNVFGDALETWAKPGSTPVPVDADPAAGDWVIDVLQTEIDRAIRENGHSHKPELKVGPWVRLIDLAQPLHLMKASTPPTGRPGVRCEQTADGWRNSVTHVLLLNGEHWPKHSPVIGLATMEWDCPGHDAENNMPSLKSVIAKAVRSRGDGKPGGA
jgi:hypothetical protein